MSVYTDNQLIQIFLPIINDALTAAGYIDVQVVQDNQPTMQGVNSPSTIYFFKVGDHRYGFLFHEDEWDPLSATMIHTESWFQETMFQVSALSTQNPANTSLLTASDLVNFVAQVMQSMATNEILQAQGIGIYRIQDIRNPSFIDDRDQYEFFPSFDFTLSYKNSIITTSNIITPPITGLVQAI